MFELEAGTVVSSHYLQWDPGNGSAGRVEATVTLDSTIFAFMTADDKLFDSDEFLGLPGLDYNDFTNRGLEGGDSTEFDGNSVNIGWFASSPGDWTRLITAFSPGGEDDRETVPDGGSTVSLLALALLGLGAAAKRRRRIRG